MDRYFLGSFGNGRFIKPQYEIDGDTLKSIEDRFTEFPNGGTIYVYFNEKENIDELKNRIIKFKLDFEKNLSPTFNTYDSSSNKYQATLNNILQLEEDEIIEIVTLDIDFDQLIADKSMRKFKLNHRPNRKVMIKISDYCYGPFECISVNDEQYFIVTIVIDSEKINKYEFSELERYVYEGTFSINNRDTLNFIYNTEKLSLVQPLEKIEYIDNDKLITFLKDIFSQVDNVENSVEILEKVSFILEENANIDMIKMNPSKINRISQLLQQVEEVKDYRIKIAQEYFDNNKNAELDKKKYIEEHEEILEEVVKKEIRYEEKKEEYNNEILSLKEYIVGLEKEIEDGKNELTRQKDSIKEVQEKVIEDKKQELEQIEFAKRQELEEIERQKKKAEEKYRSFDAIKHTLEEDIKKMRAEREGIKDDINKKILDWAAENRNSEIVSLLFSELSAVRESNIDQSYFIKTKNVETANEICSIIQDKLGEAGRNLKKDDIYNYIISVMQNYITVFAGEPGTGKTSLCKLLAKALGLYDDRFVQISVERGWTSSKDLIGYYNPLTKSIEKTQPQFSYCMEQLTKENELNKVEAPYWVMLDEANLSPIEFYWSNFNYFCDDPNNQNIKYTDGTEYRFGDELKFLATINYDHTTEILSPRFLDRAWVILMQSVSTEAILATSKDEVDVKNNNDLISLESLRKIFDWKNYKEKKLNPVTKERLNIILEKVKTMGHILSARSIKAIIHYYYVAEEYMSSKEIALDFAVAQKILPMIDGNGKEYGSCLQELISIFKNSQLEKSAEIVQKIINKAEHEFYNYFSL